MKLVSFKEDWKKRFDVALGQIGFYKYGWKHNPDEDCFSPVNAELNVLAIILMDREENNDLYAAWVVYSAMYDLMDKEGYGYLYKEMEDGTYGCAVEKLEWESDIPSTLSDQLKTIKELLVEDCKDKEELIEEMCKELEDKGAELTVQEIEAARQMVDSLNQLRQAVLQWNGIRKLKEENKDEQNH